MAYDLLGKYHGIEVYMIPKEDFLFAINEIDRIKSDMMWMIIEDRRLIKEGKVVGQVTADLKSVNDLRPLSYKIVYGNDIRKKNEKENVVIDEAKTTTTTITERATIEKLCSQGEKKLNSLLAESEEIINRYKLNQFAGEKS